MRVVLQRVAKASVEVDGTIVGAIGPGLLVLAAAAADDSDEDRDWLARKVVQLRVFPDDDGTMNRSVRDAGGENPRRLAVHALRVDAQGQPPVVVGRGAARDRAPDVRRIRCRART
jgi:D-tyrosyl-tRNA(Tyr) deacylase